MTTTVTPTPYQARVLAAITPTTQATLPSRVVASLADRISVHIDSPTGTVTRALRALEAAGLVQTVDLPGLTVPGWVHTAQPAPTPEPVATPEPTRAESIVLAALSPVVRGPREVKRRMGLGSTPLRTVGRLLLALEEKGLAQFVNAADAPGWIITPAGQAALTPKPLAKPEPAPAPAPAVKGWTVRTADRSVGVRASSIQGAVLKAWSSFGIAEGSVLAVLPTPEDETLEGLAQTLLDGMRTAPEGSSRWQLARAAAQGLLAARF